MRPGGVAWGGGGFAGRVFALLAVLIAFHGVLESLHDDVGGAEGTGFLDLLADAAILLEAGVAFDAFQFASVFGEEDDGGKWGGSRMWNEMGSMTGGKE